MSTSTTTRTTLIASLLLAGCASVDPKPDFHEVESDASQRGMPKLLWRADADADKDAREAVAEILAHEIDADGAVRLALLENRGLQAVYEELGIARSALARAARPPNPVLDAEYRFAESGGTAGIHLSLVEDFLSVLFLPLRRELAQMELDATKLRVTSAVLELAGEVRAAFYSLQAAEQEREMRESIVSATDASYDLASRLHAAGNFRDLDLDNERALHEQSKLDLARIEAEVASMREDMNALMGLWGEQTNWKIAARLPDPPEEEPVLEGLESHAIERSLDLEIARREFEAEAKRLGVQRATRFTPEMNAGVTAEREPFEGGWSVGPSLSVALPIFDQGQGELAASFAVLRQREHDYHAMAVEIRAEVRATASALLAAKSRARYYRDVMVPLRARIVGETVLQYNAMQVGAFQLLQAKRDEIDAGLEYIDALREYWIARARMEQLENGGRARRSLVGEQTAVGRRQGERSVESSGRRDNGGPHR